MLKIFEFFKLELHEQEISWVFLGEIKTKTGIDRNEGITPSLYCDGQDKAHCSGWRERKDI